MKSLLFTTLFSVIGFLSYSQCKSVKTEIDKFSKKETRKADVVVGSFNMFKGGTKWGLSFNQQEGVTTLTSIVAMVGELNQVLDETTKLLVLLDNGNVIELINTISAKPVTKALTSSQQVHIFTNYNLSFKPTKDQLKELSASPVMEVKLEVPDQTITPPKISKKSGQQIMNITQCLLESEK